MPSITESPFKKYKDWDDDTIISGEHVIRSIQEFESKVKVIKTEHGDAFIYAVETNDENVRTHRFVIGPTEIDIVIDLNNLTTVIQVYAKIPFVGEVHAATASGNLRDGVPVSFKYLPFVWGSLTVKLEEKVVMLEYSVDTLGSHYQGRIPVDTLP